MSDARADSPYNRRMRKLLLLLGIGGCFRQPPQAFYVANVYQGNNQLFIEKCSLAESKAGEVADPSTCKIIPVGELPPASVVIKGVDSEGNPAPTPPGPPPPPREPTPKGVPNSPPPEY